MRVTGALMGAADVCVLTGPVVGSGAAADPLASDARLASVEARYEMNEAAGATTMHDDSGHGLHGVIDQDGLDTGFRFDGATGYHWPRRAPDQLPAAPERVITVADSPHLDPASGVYTVTLRYRTKEHFGNIVQKGQATAKGGMWKLQNPQGRPSCQFRGSLGRASTRSPIALNDNQWHRVECVRAPDSVTMYVDGARVSRKNGATGTVDNSLPLAAGGKANCDQIEVTCDYFSGDIDYLRISRG